MKSLFAIVFVSAGLVGCSSTPENSGSMQVGPDTFRVITWAGGTIQSQKLAFSDANAFCSTNKRKMVAVSTKIHDFNRGFELNFKCLLDGDPELIRPNLQSEPDAVIQIR